MTFKINEGDTVTMVIGNKEHKMYVNSDRQIETEGYLKTEEDGFCKILNITRDRNKVRIELIKEN